MQIGDVAEQWDIAAIHARIQNGNDLIASGPTVVLKSFSQPGSTSAFALSGYWQPTNTGWRPSISAGWGLNATTTHNSSNGHTPTFSDDGGLVRTSQSWSVGLQGLNAGLPGHALGMATRCG